MLSSLFLKTRRPEKTETGSLAYGGLTLASVLSLAILLASLPLWSKPAPVLKDVDVAEKFVVALNAGNAQTMASVCGRPFFFRNQEWASATDGSGFVHGKADDQSFKDQQSLYQFFQTLVSKTKIEQEKAAVSPPSKETLLADNLKGAPARWRKLNLFVFGRGFGDVEHVAIVGVDPGTHRVRGLYLN